jgi:hypothetical protein
MQSKYFIIAGKKIEFDLFIRKKLSELYEAGNTSLTLSDFVYVSSRDTLRGHRNPHGYFIGAWRERSDIVEIFEQLISISDDETKIIKMIDDYNIWIMENRPK